jgi:GNAT superfamily N-acetyltransferase
VTAPDGLLIRRAGPGELGAVVALYEQLHDHSPPRDERHEAAFAEILVSPGRAILVAQLGDALVGTLDLFIVTNLTRGAMPWAGIENFVVDSAHRGRGIGDAMLEAAVSIAREAGCYKVQLISHEVHAPAHVFYAQRGFDAPVRGFRRYLEDL